MSLGQGNEIFFNSIDLLSVYWQVPLAHTSLEITAFSTPTGHFEWLRLPFCLKSAPITFQRIINTLFCEILGKDVYEDLDDLFICCKNGDNHFADLEAVLLKLSEDGLKARLTKSELLKAKITFSGHTVDWNAIHTMDNKTSTIKNLTQPRTVENVRSFIGLCGYYRPFIDGFAKILSPLTELLKKETPLNWNATQEMSFNDLKSALINAPFSAPGL